jgi:hypothetical protein
VTASTSRLAYDDVFECYDRALKDEFGIRIKFESHGDIMHFRSRLNVARSIDRKDNREIYPRDHPMHGVSQYDRIICRVREVDGVWWLYMLPILGAGALEIESLTSFDIPALPKRERESVEYQLTFNGGPTPTPEPKPPPEPAPEIIPPRPKPVEPSLVATPKPMIVIRRR